MCKLIKMINSGLPLADFFAMHPYSRTISKTYRDAYGSIDYFNKLYVVGTRSFLHLVYVANFLNNRDARTMFVSGYCGCGKTNFVQLLRYLAEGGELKQSFDKVELLEKRAIGKGGNDKFKAEIDDTIQLIRKAMLYKVCQDDNRLDGVRVSRPENHAYPEEFVRSAELTRWINQNIQGTFHYVNFDIRSFGVEKRVLYLHIVELIQESYESLYEHIKSEAIILFMDFLALHKDRIRSTFRADNDPADTELRDIEHFIEKILSIRSDILDESFKSIAKKLISKLSADQMLLIYMIWLYSVSIAKKDYDKSCLVVFDNIDIVSEQDYDEFSDTIHGMLRYTWNVQVLFDEIDGHCKDDLSQKFYKQFARHKLIVTMRDTSVMYFDHINSRQQRLVKCIDVAKDVNKSIILLRRLEILKEAIDNNEITNEEYILAELVLRKLLQCKSVVKFLPTLYNNDYRVFSKTLAYIAINSIDALQKYVDIMESKDADSNSYYVFGARGIIYKQILDLFLENRYLEAIGVEKGYNGFSSSRLILTVLAKEQGYATHNVMDWDDNYLIEIRDLTKRIAIIEPESIANAIGAMFSLRNKSLWSHLITFDHAKSYENSYLRERITSTDDNPKIFVSVTDAGMEYIRHICIHFEFFSTRFSTLQNRKALFQYTVFRNKSDVHTVCKLMDEVFAAVKKCCKHLDKINLEIIRRFGLSNYEQIGDDFRFSGQFHEERIIHNHISYLEAYREYLCGLQINNPWMHELHTHIVDMIKNYLKLLRYDPGESGENLFRKLFITENSRLLYDELMTCIWHLEKLYRDGKTDELGSVEIKRSFYRQKYKTTLLYPKGCEYYGLDS